MIRPSVRAALITTFAFFLAAHAQDANYRGRKYKAPPPISHIEVEVLKGYNGKPVANAAVIFHEVRDGRDEGNLEVKTNDEGKATIDVIAIGSAVDVQVLADGFATFAQQYQVTQAKQDIQVTMLRPRAPRSPPMRTTGAKHPRGPLAFRSPTGLRQRRLSRLRSRPITRATPNPLAPIDPGATPGNSQNQQTGHPFRCAATAVSASSRPLAGKTVLITGATRRIGQEIAWVLADAGANIVLTYRCDASGLAATRAGLVARGAEVFETACDLLTHDGPGSALERAVERFGGLDILVNNAGIFESAALEEITPEQWDAMFATNTRGPFLMAKAAHAALKLSRGRIVNIGSLGGLKAWATHGHYCASKAALHMLSQTMAKAWAPEISVNCVAPGMIAMGEEDAAYAALAEKTPMRRNGAAADVAAAVLFFAVCPGFITGQILAVDGGPEFIAYPRWRAGDPVQKD